MVSWSIQPKRGIRITPCSKSAGGELLTRFTRAFKEYKMMKKMPCVRGGAVPHVWKNVLNWIAKEFNIDRKLHEHSILAMKDGEKRGNLESNNPDILICRKGLYS